MSYLADPTIVIIDWSPEGSNPVNPINLVARYRLLEDHQINDQLYLAGTIVNAGFEVPTNWIPSPNVEPLNTLAVNAFYAQGPQDLGLVRQQWTNVGFPGPVTYWKRSGANAWVLTGLGAGLPALPAIIPHPVRGYPQ